MLFKPYLNKFIALPQRVDNEDNLLFRYLGARNSVVDDYSGTGHYAIFQGSTNGYKNAPGLFQFPFFMDGSSNYLNLGDFAENATGTIAFWFTPTTTISSGVDQAIWSDTESNATSTLFLRWGSDLSPGGVIRLGVQVSAVFKTCQTTTQVWQANQWYHLAASWDGTTARLYVNGTQEASVAAGSPDTVAANWNLGRGPTGTGTVYFNGSMGDMRLYKRAISAMEVNSLYNEPFSTNIWAAQEELNQYSLTTSTPSTSDSLLVLLSETSSIASTLALTDSLLVLLSESASFPTIGVSVSDELFPKLTELSALLWKLSVTESLLLLYEDRLNLLQLLNRVDSFLITLGETLSQPPIDIGFSPLSASPNIEATVSALVCLIEELQATASLSKVLDGSLEIEPTVSSSGFQL